MTDLKVNDLEAGKTYCAKRPGATTWSLFGEVIINNANLKQIQYKHYDTHTTNYLDLEGTTFKLRDGDLCYEEPATTTGGRNKKKSLKANKNKSLKANKKKSLKANKNKSLKANKKKSLKANKKKKKSSKH